MRAKLKPMRNSGRDAVVFLVMVLVGGVSSTGEKVLSATEDQGLSYKGALLKGRVKR